MGSPWSSSGRSAAPTVSRKKLHRRDVPALALHGDMSQSQRERALARFRAGTVSTLVANDVAARGLDLTDITHVINFDPPVDDKGYVHRVGRTGRAGRGGNGSPLSSRAAGGRQPRGGRGSGTASSSSRGGMRVARPSASTRAGGAPVAVVAVVTPGWAEVEALLGKLAASGETFTTAISPANWISRYEPGRRIRLESEADSSWVDVENIRGCWETFERLGRIRRSDVLDPGRCSAFMMALFERNRGHRARGRRRAVPRAAAVSPAPAPRVAPRRGRRRASSSPASARRRARVVPRSGRPRRRSGRLDEDDAVELEPFRRARRQSLNRGRELVERRAGTGEERLEPGDQRRGRDQRRPSFTQRLVTGFAHRRGDEVLRLRLHEARRFVAFAYAIGAATSGAISGSSGSASSSTSRGTRYARRSSSICASAPRYGSRSCQLR